MKGRNMIRINGRVFEGNSVSISNGVVLIDGKKVADGDSLEEKSISIVIDGNVESLDVDCCDTISVSGNVESLSSNVGEVRIEGDVREFENNCGNVVIRGSVNRVENNCGNVSHN